MKKFIAMLALAGFLGAPLFAQEAGPEPQPKSDAELLAELHRLMKKASEEMGQLESELAKASLDAPKADVIAERIKKIRESMESGKLDELPEGLREYLRQNPEEAAKLTGKSEEEIRKAAEKNDELLELLKKNPELLKKLAQSEDTMEEIVKHQHEAERKLAETLRKQQEAAEQAREKVNESIDIAHELSSRNPQSSPGQPDNKGEKSKDPREGNKPQQGDPSKGAEEQYNPGNGENKPEDKTGDFKRAEGEGFQTDKQGKDMQDASSSQDRREPGKYKGFWEKFAEESAKRAEQRKAPNK
jgi:hypothetical protein